MSTEKKVIFLFLLLIVVIISCVNVHTPEILKQKGLVADTPNEITIPKDENSQTQTSDEVVTQEVAVDPTQTKDSGVVMVPENDQATQKENAADEKSVATQNEIIVNTNESTKEETTSSVEEKQENTTVEEIKPLLTTDPRYKREGDEKKIEDLSMASQQIQVDINDFIKKNPIIFKRASFKLNEDSMKSIRMIADILKLNPNLKMEVAGHTDAAGRAKDNREISYERARRVKNALVDLGIDESRLIVRGYGEDIPMVKNSPNGYSKINRRVEFNIVEE